MNRIMAFLVSAHNVLKSELSTANGYNIESDRIRGIIDGLISFNSGISTVFPFVNGIVPEFKTPKSYNNDHTYYYENSSIQGIYNTLDLLLTMRTEINSLNTNVQSRPRRVFISHGSSQEWRKVQTYIERVLEIPTLELAQEADMGRTIFQKLIEETDKCNYAVIVMTGDDIYESQTRARENVIHEIGYIQGKYGANRLCILHEEYVNIPSNIQGVVYKPFPKSLVDATFGGLTQELKHI